MTTRGDAGRSVARIDGETASSGVGGSPAKPLPHYCEPCDTKSVENLAKKWHSISEFEVRESKRRISFRASLTQKKAQTSRLQKLPVSEKAMSKEATARCPASMHASANCEYIQNRPG
jgi:hypothetical protein